MLAPFPYFWGMGFTLGVGGLGFGVCGLEFRVRGLGFEVLNFGGCVGVGLRLRV